MFLFLSCSLFKDLNFDEKYFDQNEINTISYKSLVNSKNYITINNDTLRLIASRFVNRMPTTNRNGWSVSRRIKLGIKQNLIGYNRYFKYLWVIQKNEVLMEEKLDNDNYFYLSDEIDLNEKLKIVVLIRSDSTSYLLQRNDIKINAVY